MIQAMASHSQSQAGGGGYAGPSGRQPQGLARQGSLYSLTLDEVQNQLTEPLLSMNLDELLKSVFPDGVDPDGAVAGQSEPPLGLHRQGSITMPPELSKKTVDEVWKGILDSPKKKSGEEGGWRRRERQLTLGEMTLEDFLLKAGVVTEGCLKDSSDFPPNMDAAGSSVIAAAAPSSSSTPQAQWLQQYQQQALEPPHPSMAGSFMATQLAPQPLAVATGAILESIYSDGQITSPMLSALSDPQTPGRKRGASSGGVPDKVVERRRKRMIKNRESAARSRARKQAYTNELENKVSHLEEENERLKRQKELDMLMISAPPPEPKYRLRRTSSSPV
ncbi:ABSCISIC ACID-INSENSITIVE 5-like protein 2 [Lolium rigidum]|uniref:ABSCISIC ACID-INSENSITIVE 5-like protein 2 n=1 Tax=Lolium rigidum TaxID=89674 RepID=UPI001F5C6214|nr:ABSCISIC ACID-INSENSITIVE 5-like protein 2 [Lolium rigidum]XP_047044582.1 ABSCISIC ACID-INSENSITIVE 5-like protein 2 [Lolium rigidum]